MTDNHSALDELNAVNYELSQYDQELDNHAMTTAEIHAQIARLRLELSKLQDKSYAVKQKIRAAKKNKESAERKVELEKEAQRIKIDINAKRKEAEELLKSALWYNPDYLNGKAEKKDSDAFKWQIEGALGLPNRALLGDKRGMGKTLSALIWRRLMKSKRTLVCLRREVADDFIKEIYIREPNVPVISLVSVTADSRKLYAQLLAAQEGYIVVTNIESWRRDIEGVTADLLKVPYDSIILDEAHHISNFGTGTSKGFQILAKSVDNILEMTGTPIKNRPQEMFSLLHALYPMQFETLAKFLKDYCWQIKQNHWTFTEDGLRNLIKKISHFYLARTPEDVGREIPPPQVITYNLTMDNHPLQKAAYKSMAERAMAILSSGQVVPIVSQLAIMTRQAQALSWPAGIKFKDRNEFGEWNGDYIQFDVEESVKVDWAENFVQELVEEGNRIVLFSRFVPVIYELKRRLENAGVRVAVITGKEKQNNREIFDDFDLKTASKDDYKYDILLATYQTVGESANLNAAEHMILIDRYWNPGNETQAIGRIDRINSKKQATVHVPHVDNSFDDYMDMLIERKSKIVTSFKDVAEEAANLREHLEKTL